jgi:transcriptional regulator with XRE-family HTH domain
MMPASIHDRLKLIRKTLNVSQKTLAKGIVISTSYYAGLELGYRKVNNRSIDLMGTVYHVNRDWMLTGEGGMFDNPPPDMRLEELIQIFTKLNGFFKDYILEHIRKLEKIQKEEQDQPLR